MDNLLPSPEPSISEMLSECLSNMKAVTSSLEEAYRLACAQRGIPVAREQIAAVPLPELGEFTDPRDGRTYKTVKIGKQISVRCVQDAGGAV